MEHSAIEHFLTLPAAIAIFGLAFGAWAWVVAWGINIVKREVHSLKIAAESTSKSLEAHVLLTEKRLTMLEVEFGYLRRYMTSQHAVQPESD